MGRGSRGSDRAEKGKGVTIVAINNQELERLAELSAELDLRNSDDLKRYFELISRLTRAEVLKLAELHRRRAHGEFA